MAGGEAAISQELVGVRVEIWRSSFEETLEILMFLESARRRSEPQSWRARRRAVCHIVDQLHTSGRHLPINALELRTCVRARRSPRLVATTGSNALSCAEQRDGHHL